MESEVDDRELRLITYNVWFNEELEVEERMREICRLVIENRADIVAFQECTPLIYGLLKSTLGTQQLKFTFIDQNTTGGLQYPYFTAIAVRTHSATTSFNTYQGFKTSKMGRGLLSTTVNLTTTKGNLIKVCVGTTHLESPVPFYPATQLRQQQLDECLSTLEELHNTSSCNVTVLLGDLNWIAGKKEGLQLRREGWVDLWDSCYQADSKNKGYTYDQKLNPMLPTSKLRSRLDRVLLLPTKKDEWTMNCSIKMIGTEQIRDLEYDCDFKNSRLRLPVLPSDHFGLFSRVFFRRLKLA